MKSSNVACACLQQAGLSLASHFSLGHLLLKVFLSCQASLIGFGVWARAM